MIFDDAENMLLRRARGVLEARMSADELVLLAADGRVYLDLDRIGAEIWERLARPMRPADLARDLARDFDAAPERIAADIGPFLAELVAEGALELIAGPLPAADAGEVGEGAADRGASDQGAAGRPMADAGGADEGGADAGAAADEPGADAGDAGRGGADTGDSNGAPGRA
ncbi:PqqD family protein [Oceanicella actignis]|uniref:PqqD family protein n=1 Tax=Oceanicella actignis TaxID=1189325 RepID=UPI0011E88010|nr:PqqD family protein [Oceanicella actignis]TYO89648.1 coenzyme PQQ synthesis protein D (PqqD) [Oceanicella actignis]